MKYFVLNYWFFSIGCSSTINWWYWLSNINLSWTTTTVEKNCRISDMKNSLIDSVFVLESFVARSLCWHNFSISYWWRFSSSSSSCSDICKVNSFLLSINNIFLLDLSIEVHFFHVNGRYIHYLNGLIHHANGYIIFTIHSNNRIVQPKNPMRKRFPVYRR